MKTRFQTPSTRPIKRDDHIWGIVSGPNGEVVYWRCCMCGAVAVAPPSYPTPKEWMPIHYESLTVSDREAYAEIPR
jgi:hypothetical protein